MPTGKNKGRKWTDDDLKKLLKMKLNGSTSTEIAKILGRSEASVNIKISTYALNSEGYNTKDTAILKEKIRKMWLDDDMSPMDIIDALNVYQLKVYDLLRIIQLEAELAGIKIKEEKRLIKSSYTEDNDTCEPVYLDKKVAKIEHDADELIEAYSKIKNIMDNDDTEQSEVSISINTPAEWILLVMSGDFHLGSRRTDPLKIKEDMELIANTSNAYFGFLGDATDNFITGTPFGGVVEQMMTPSIARKIYAAIIKKLKNKLLFAATGCHDLWSLDRDDYNMIQDITKVTGCAYMGYGGKVHLLINSSVVYDITAYHKLPGGSIYNMFHSCITHLQRKDMDNDIVAHAHNHVSGISTQDLQGRQRVFIRTGSYKSADNFIRKIGYKPITDDVHENIVPCVLLNTNKKEMRIANSLQSGIEMLEFLNWKGPKNEERSIKPMSKKRNTKERKDKKNKK